MSNVVFITRVVPHPIQSVFEALTKPEYVLQWFGPLKMITTNAEIDLRKGGSYIFTVARPDGSEFTIQGEYEQISPPEKLVFTARYEGLANASGIESLVVITLTSINEGTEISLSQQFNLIPADIERRTESWEQMFEKLGTMIIPEA